MTRGEKKCVIEDIFWERVFLHIHVYNNTGRKLFLRNQRDIISLEQSTVSSQFENRFHITVNISAINNRSFLKNGKWEVGFFDSENIPEGDSPFKPEKDENRDDLFHFCTVSEALANRLDDLDKIFRYSGIRYAYTVNFHAYTLDGVNMHLNLCSFFMKENKNWKNSDSIFEANTLKGVVLRSIFNFKKQIIVFFYKMISLFSPKTGKNILFLTETKNTLDGNLKAILNRMIQRRLESKFDIQTSCRVAVGENNNILSWLKMIYKVARADCIFIDNFVPIFSKIDLNPKTKLIQVWHAGIGFKGVGYARFGKVGSPQPSKSVHRKYSKALAPSVATVKVYEEVFGIEKEAFLPIGLPRLDGFLDHDKIESFRNNFYQHLPKLIGKKIILFAPTYRGKGQKSAYYDYSKIDFKRIYDFCGDEYVFVIKMHPFIKDKLEHYSNRDPLDRSWMAHVKPDLSSFSERIVEFPNTMELNEFFYVTDILITDYSSAFYEFSILKKPILFYVYDRVIYENVRGVHHKISEVAPGKVCNTFDELMKALEEKDYDMEKTIQFYKDNFLEKPNGATDRLLDMVLLNKEMVE